MVAPAEARQNHHERWIYTHAIIPMKEPELRTPDPTRMDIELHNVT
jgi:hypothetical protein